MDSAGLPLDVVLLVIVVMPVGVAVFFGLFAFEHLPPLVFHCGRCARVFTRKPWRRFPRACPRCGGRDWNATS